MHYTPWICSMCNYCYEWNAWVALPVDLRLNFLGGVCEFYTAWDVALDVVSLSFWACLAATVMPGGSIRIQSVALVEALVAYHEAGEIEAFQCIHAPVGKNNEPIQDAKPIAVEFDQKIYVRIHGVLLGLDWVGSTPERSSFSGRGTRAEVWVRRRMNHGQYGESEDRLMRLQVLLGGKKLSLNTFGAACGA